MKKTWGKIDETKYKIQGGGFKYQMCYSQNKDVFRIFNFAQCWMKYLYVPRKNVRHSSSVLVDIKGASEWTVTKHQHNIHYITNKTGH